MRLFGHLRFICSDRLPATQLGLLTLLLAGMLSPLRGQAQQAPYVLPFTMTTYAGANTAYTVGAPCVGNPSLAAFDLDGDGCLATQASVNTDPHDIRVDPFGFVYYADNGSSAGLVHRINPYTGLFTSYFGNVVGNSKLCSGASALTGKSGVNCVSTDGIANSGPYNILTNSTGGANGPFYAVNTGALRGLGVDGAGNLFLANYGQDLVESIAAVGHKVGLVAGEYHTTGLINGAAYTDGVTQVNGARGVGIDGAGNLYIADTGNSVLRLVSNGQITTITAANTGSATFSNATNVPSSTAVLNAPEDAQVDIYGNIFIADQGNALVRVIYHGAVPAHGAPTQTSFFGIPSPVVGNIYTIAGNFVGPPVSTSCPVSTSAPKPGQPQMATAYNSALTQVNGVSTTVPATSVPMAIRKLGVDSHGNVYLADSCNGVVFFVDSTTGNARVIAGIYGNAGQSTAPTAGLCSTHINAVGDGCPGAQSSLDPNSNMGTQPDPLGNLYITDSEGGTSALSRIRKLVSGLAFPVTTTGNPVTQKVMIHFAATDGPSTTSPYAFTGNDFALVSAPSCTVQTDTTQDCVLPISFTPTVAGYETGTLTVTSQAGATASFQLSGTATAPILAFDPGNTSQLAASVSSSQGVALDGAGNAYIADTGNNQVLFYSASSATTSIFIPASAGLNAPKGVALGTDGSVYIADTGNNLIRKATPAGVLTTIGGGGTACAAATDAFGDNCLATQATFASPSGIATDYLGQVFVSDTGNNVIRQIGTSGYVRLLAGGATSLCPVSPYATPVATDTVGDGCGALQTTFKSPTGLAFDGSANLYVADTGNNIVRKINLGTSFTNSNNFASSIAVNPVTLVAGTLTAGYTLDSNFVATNSELSGPTGVAVSASGTVYIADTGNNAVRMVTGNNISTIVGILASSGTGTLGNATTTQLNAPGAVAVTPSGTLFVLDSGNNRVISDNRSAVSQNFGFINVNSSSPVQNFTEINLGTTIATLPTPLFTQAPSNAELTLTPASLNNNSIPACASGTIASAGICGVQAQFSPTAPGAVSSTFTQSGTGVPAAAAGASITLSGTGLVLSPTTSTISQTVPATGSPVFGGALTVQVAVTANTCSPVPGASCAPAGTVIFSVDSQASAPVALTPGSPVSLSFPGLAVGPHTFSCSFTSNDGLYASSSCASIVINVTQAPTQSVLTATNSKQPQFLNTNCSTNPGTGITTCIVSTLTANVSSTTVGTPTGTVTFFVNGTAVGSSTLTNTGAANVNFAYSYDVNGILASNNTLTPGTYSLTCSYAGSNNFAASNCAPVTFTVLPQANAITLTPRGCVASSLYPSGTFTPALGQQCPSGVFTSGVPTVATADGSTTDATIFIIPSNTASGTVTFSCSGLPANTACTFQPTSVTLTAGTTYATPTYTDVTFFTDVKQTSAIARPTNGTSLAMMLGWPITAFSLLALLILRRKKSLRGLSLLATIILMTGSALTFSGCAGPGNYTPSFTPAGTYPITITATNGSVTSTTIVDLTVTAPGIVGQQ